MGNDFPPKRVSLGFNFRVPGGMCRQLQLNVVHKKGDLRGLPATRDAFFLRSQVGNPTAEP